MICPFCGGPGARETTGRGHLSIVWCCTCNVVYDGLPDNYGKWTRHPTFGDPWRSDRNRLGLRRAS